MIEAVIFQGEEVAVFIDSRINCLQSGMHFENVKSAISHRKPVSGGLHHGVLKRPGY